MPVSEVLSQHNIPFKIVEHPPVYTVADTLVHFPNIFPVKNLLLKEEKGMSCVFVIMKGDERLDTKWLAIVMNMKKLQFAKPEVLMNVLGVEPGSASLFSVLHTGSGGVSIVIDARLIAQPQIGFHPDANTRTLFINGKDVQIFLEAIGRQYHILDFGQTA